MGPGGLILGIRVREDNMKSVRESTQEKKPTLVLGGTGKTGQHAREGNVVTSGHRRAVGTITMLLGIVVALTLVLAACGWEVDETASGTVIGKIEQSELGSGKSAGATFDLSPGKYVFICNLGGHYRNGMYAGFTVKSLDDSKSATVGVELGEWFINSGSASVAAGSVTFEVSNIGKSGHELVLIKTDLAPDAL